LLGALLVVSPLPWRLRLLGLPLTLPLLFPPIERPPPGRFEVVAADIGQGTAVLVRTARHLLVYDTGPQYSLEADAGQRVLLPLLRSRGETQVDLLMLSHRDSDHVGGTASLLAGMPVLAMSSSLDEAHPLRQRGLAHRRCEAGQRWDWDGVKFELLHPTAAEHDSATKSNAVSCVLHVVGGATSLLLTGDIEAPQEAALLARGADLHADVLLVPHHGSRTSSTPAFIEAVAPRTAVVQAAYRSRFHHPQPDIVERYTGRGIEVVRSDRCGAWSLAADGSAECERQTARRYWHHRVLPVEN
jgi:competence protein ComEC